MLISVYFGFFLFLGSSGELASWCPSLPRSSGERTRDRGGESDSGMDAVSSVFLDFFSCSNVALESRLRFLVVCFGEDGSLGGDEGGMEPVSVSSVAGFPRISARQRGIWSIGFWDFTVDKGIADRGALLGVAEATLPVGVACR